MKVVWVLNMRCQLRQNLVRKAREGLICRHKPLVTNRQRLLTFEAKMAQKAEL